MEKSRPSDKLTRLTLDKAWEEADAEFYKLTQRHLNSTSPNGKKGVLDTWKKKYDLDGSDAKRKYNYMFDLLENIANGIEVVGAFAAQAASTVFGPADMCFNAFQFLLSAPLQIKKVYDTLRALFEEVGDFLVKFKILKRIDDSKGLDEDLIINTNKILISFVNICALSIKILEGYKISTALKVVFLKDDRGVSGELENFRRLAENQSQLAGMVTLESVINSEESMKRILDTADETKTIVMSLAATNNDEKTRLVNKESLHYIEQKIFGKDDLLLRGDSPPAEFRNDLLPGTVDVLESSSLFKSWQSGTRTGLKIYGESGSGKSCLVEALKSKLDEKRRSATKNDPSTYVALHRFHSVRSALGVSKVASLPYALRDMAYQVASQSTVFVKVLEQQLRKKPEIAQMEDCSKLWNALQLSAFEAPAGSTLYLIFDGLQRLNTEEDDKITDLVETLTARVQYQHSSLNIRVLLTLEEGSRFWDLDVPFVDTEDMVAPLITSFTSRELKRMQIFQDESKTSLLNRTHVIETLTKADGSFPSVKRKLAALREAVENDAPRDQLDNILLQGLEWAELEDLGKQVLDQSAAVLSPQHISELNFILAWVLYGDCDLKVDFLEAALYLERESETLEPLLRKIKHRYKGILDADERSVECDADVSAFLKKSSNLPVESITQKESVISMNISIKNAPESAVRQFIWDLNQQVASGKFEFESKEMPKNGVIHVNELQARLKIFKLCLKVLNDGWDSKTETLVEYARDYFPSHLQFLEDKFEKIAPADHKSITKALIKYLSDPYYLLNSDFAWGDSTSWRGNSSIRKAINRWLQKCKMILPLRERQWVEQNTGDEDSLQFLNQFACAIGKKWLEWDSPKELVAEGTFKWLRGFVEMISREKSSTEADAAKKELHSSSDDEESSEDPNQKDRDQVKVVVRWLRSHGVDVKGYPTYHLALGSAYGQGAKAKKHYEIATSDVRLRKYALFKLGNFLLDGDGDEGEAFEYIAKAVEFFKSDAVEGGTTERDTRRNYLVKAAELYEEHDLWAEAISVYQARIALDPGDHDARVNVLECMCMEMRWSEATTLIKEWSAHAKEFGGPRLADQFLDAARNGVFDDGIKQRYLDRCLGDTPVMEAMRRELEEAVILARKEPSSLALPRLLYLQGLATATVPSRSPWKTAIELWEDALESPVPKATLDDISRVGKEQFGRLFVIALSPVSNILVKCKFNSVLEKLQAPSVRTEDVGKALVQEFEDYMSSPTIQRGEFGINSPATILRRAALAAARGDKKEARVVMRPRMSEALTILSDDDLTNDYNGATLMIQAFLAVGDKVGALTAFSIYDRQSRKGSQRTFDHPSWNSCSGCGSDIESTSKDGSWQCCYCEITRFCRDCYVGLKSHEKRLWHCHPNHDFVHLYHTDYTPEEDAPGMIRVGWQFVPVPPQKSDRTIEEFERKGGKVVEISRWVEDLRKEWHIPAPLRNIRAQR